MDDPVLVAGLVEAVRLDTVAYLEAEHSRLRQYARLLGRFDKACRAWSEKQTANARQITETVNELLIAKRFLQDPLCARIEYEPSFDGDNKTIDFLFHTTEGTRIFMTLRRFIRKNEMRGIDTRRRLRKGGLVRARS